MDCKSLSTEYMSRMCKDCVSCNAWILCNFIMADISYIYKIIGQKSLGNYFFIDFMHWVLFCQNKIAAWFLSLWVPNGDIIENFLFLRPSIWQLSPIWYSRYLIKQKCTYFLHLPKNIHILFRNHPVMHSTVLEISGCPVFRDDLKCVRATSF